MAAIAPVYYSPLGVFLFFFFGSFTFLFGITVGYHRLLTHRSFSTSLAFARILALLGTLALQDGPVTWVAIHRVHHRSSDVDGDPHTPRHGFFWAHMFWFTFKHPELRTHETRRVFAKDIDRDPFLRWLEIYYYPLHFSVALLLFGIGYASAGVNGGFSALIWGGALRIVAVWHVTFLVNSAAHVWGYQTYDTGDGSRNNWFVAILACGEGWHNNHHANPRAANFGVQRWEIDLGFYTVRLLEALNLAWNVKVSARSGR